MTKVTFHNLPLNDVLSTLLHPVMGWCQSDEKREGGGAAAVKDPAEPGMTGIWCLRV